MTPGGARKDEQSPKLAGKRHCHVCRSPKDVSKIVECSSGKRSHIFCSSCLERRLHTTMAEVLADPAWVCPKCRLCCPCSKCRKRDNDSPATTRRRPERGLQPDDTAAALTLLAMKQSPVFPRPLAVGEVPATPATPPPSPATPRAAHADQSPSFSFSRLAIHSQGSSPSLSPHSIEASPRFEPLPLALPPHHALDFAHPHHHDHHDHHDHHGNNNGAGRGGGLCRGSLNDYGKRSGLRRVQSANSDDGEFAKPVRARSSSVLDLGSDHAVPAMVAGAPPVPPPTPASTPRKGSSPFVGAVPLLSLAAAKAAPLVSTARREQPAPDQAP